MSGQPSATRTATIDAVIHTASRFSDVERDVLQTVKTVVGFTVADVPMTLFAEIESAQVSATETGERLDLVLRVEPDVAAEMADHESPVEVEPDNNARVYIAMVALAAQHRQPMDGPTWIYGPW